MRVVRTRVLPLPAPARISADWLPSVTAACCSGLRLESRSDIADASQNYISIGLGFPPKFAEKHAPRNGQPLQSQLFPQRFDEQLFAVSRLRIDLGLDLD